jgi:tRNA(adenine34) deaminase
MSEQHAPAPQLHQIAEDATFSPVLDSSSEKIPHKNFVICFSRTNGDNKLYIFPFSFDFDKTITKRLLSTAMQANIQHEFFMQIALDEARKAVSAGEVPTGCVIIRTDLHVHSPQSMIIARTHNQVELLKDPTAHAEMLAITEACSAIGDWRLNNTILYVTKEPCVMCAGAIVLARIPIIVFGTPDTERGAACSVFNILSSPHLNHRPQLIQGVMEYECRTILQEFFRTKRTQSSRNA